MSDSPVAVAPSPEAPPIGELQRLINLVIAPSKTFADVGRKPMWIVPAILLILGSLAFGITAGKTIGFEQLSQNQIRMSPGAQARMEQVPPDRRAQAERQNVVVTKVITY